MSLYSSTILSLESSLIEFGFALKINNYEKNMPYFSIYENFKFDAIGLV